MMRRMWWIVASAASLALVMGISVVLFMYRTLDQEVSQWSARALELSARARVRMVEQHVARAQDMVRQLALKAGDGGLPSGGGDDVPLRLEEALAGAEDARGFAIIDAAGRSLLTAGEAIRHLPPPLLASQVPGVAPIVHDGHPMLLAWAPITAGGVVSGYHCLLYRLDTLATHFASDLGLGVGVERRLVALVDGCLEQLLPSGMPVFDQDSSAFLHLSSDPARIARGPGQPTFVDVRDPMMGIYYPFSGMAVVIDIDRDSVVHQRRTHKRMVSAASAACVVVVAFGSLLALWPLARRMSRQAAALAESRRLREEQARELERSNAELAQFALVASHDLQEPLRMIRSFIDLVDRRHGGQLPGQAREWLGMARGGADRLQAMVQGLLEYARIGHRIEAEPVDLDGVTREAVANLGTVIASAGARVEVEAMPRVRGNRIQLVRLLQNLIGNGVKFAQRADPLIRIVAERDGGWWTVGVSDNGPGVQPAHEARLFRLFERLEAAREVPGTGIGLAACKRIVENHGGRIWVRPTPGGGATFLFTVPAE